MATKKAKLKDLVLDPRNANRHTEYGSGLLVNSTRENGIGRSILISDDNVVIAGNGLAEAGYQIGIEDVEIVESDGKKIIAVKRTDIKSNTPAFYNMALADNIVAEKNILLDAEVVHGIVQDFPETKFWGSVVDEEPESATDKDKANTVEMKFQFTGPQAAKVKQAIKVAKQVKKAPKDANANSFALIHIVNEFLKRQK
jgi:hypothetical protein